MKNKNIGSLTLVLGVIILCGLIFFFITQFSRERNNKGVDDFVQKNIEEINSLKQETENNNKLADSSWQDYINNELGISFQYPDSWGDVNLKYVDETMSLEEINGPKVFKGNGAYLTFTNNYAYILLASSDFSQFLVDSYNGGKNLSSGCLSMNSLNTNIDYYRSYCRDIIVANQKTYGYYQNWNAECSGDNLWYHVPLNLPQDKSDYSGLQINYFIDFPINETDFSDPCGRTPENIKANLEAVSKRENLNDEMVRSLADYDKFLTSFKFLE